MKFIALLTAILVFAISAANAAKEGVTLKFSRIDGIYPPLYQIRTKVADTTYDIMLQTFELNGLPRGTRFSDGTIEYDNNAILEGTYDAVINNNDAKNGDKTLRLDLVGPVAIHYEGTSITDERIYDLKGEGTVHRDGGDDFGYSRHRFYRYQDKYPCNH